MTDTGADMHTITLEKDWQLLLNALSGKNRSTQPSEPMQPISRSLSHFSTRITCRFIRLQRSRKLMCGVSLRACQTGIKGLPERERCQRYGSISVSEGVGVITKSPTTGIETPKREKNSRQYLRSDEYTKIFWLGQTPETTRCCRSFCKRASGYRS